MLISRSTADVNQWQTLTLTNPDTYIAGEKRDTVVLSLCTNCDSMYCLGFPTQTLTWSVAWRVPDFYLAITIAGNVHRANGVYLKNGMFWKPWLLVVSCSAPLHHTLCPQVGTCLLLAPLVAYWFSVGVDRSDFHHYARWSICEQSIVLCQKYCYTHSLSFSLSLPRSLSLSLYIYKPTHTLASTHTHTHIHIHTHSERARDRARGGS